MSISHRTNRLKLISAPSVEKLQNDRFRLVFNATPLNPREDWYNANKSRIFADYGSLQSAEMSIDGISARTGAAYSDMRLTDVQTTSGADSYIVQFTYETLGSSFVQVKDDTIDFELNGLRRVTRTSIAQAGTDFQKTVGTTSITSQIDTESAVTCFLASYEIDDTDSYREVTEVYIQAGTLSVSTKNLAEGVKQITTEFLVTEGTTVGPVTARSTQDFEGLKTISVTTMQDKNGNALGANGSTPVHNFEVFSDFSYPGLFTVSNTFTTTAVAPFERVANIAIELTKAPVQSKVKSTVYVFFTTTSTIASTDYKYDSASGLWSPNDWGSVQVTAESAIPGTSFKVSKALRGYRSASSTITGTIDATFGLLAEFRYQDSTRLSSANPITFTAAVNPGPSTPVGSKWVLDVQITPAFDDVNGNTYFKKTIIVTDAIPAQESSSGGPYD
tara:strand:+ start:1863 stop:3200 length:1338 start_codon:yes stop_codon:yes gene_type:complete